MLVFADRSQLRLLLDHFGLVEDDREPWRVAHPLPEVLLLAVCGTIGACDDFDEIAEWGEDNLDFLRRFLPYHHGVPGARWLRILLNRIDPQLFCECFRLGRARCGRTRRNSSPSTARLRAAATIAGEAVRRCIWSPPSPRPNVSSSVRKRWARVPASRTRSPCSSQSRSRTAHGPANMAVVRHFAFNIVRAVADKRSLKLRRKKAGRNNQYLAQILNASAR